MFKFGLIWKFAALLEVVALWRELADKALVTDNFRVRVRY
jgi:hypothetical protein